MSDSTTNRLVTIYALCDPDTDAIRYIGQSVDPDTRIKAHIQSSFTGTSKRDKWIRSLLTNGQVPKLITLAAVSVAEADALELSTIKQYRKDGYNLVNGIDSAHGGMSGTKPRPPRTEITFKVSPYTALVIEKHAPAYGGKDKLLMMLVDRFIR